LVDDVKDYRWSRAAAHLSGKDSSGVLDMEFWAREGGANQWASLLTVPGEEAEYKRLRMATYAGNPLGSGEFVEKAKSLLAERSARLLGRKAPRSEDGLANASGVGVWGAGGL